MKSFFKKLAFVMALAMVVTMAAPAAANAATKIDIYYQDGNTAVTEFGLSVGEEKDLKFVGAPTGWRDLEYGWEVIEGNAVTVDKVSGLVKAVSNGVAKVAFVMEGCDTAVVTVTVGTEVKVGIDQKSEIEFDVVFTKKVNYKEEDVTLYRVFETAKGDVKVYWPIDKFTCKDNVLTIAPFVMFGDDDKYIVDVDGKEYEFTTVIPELSEITHVETYVKNPKDLMVSNDETDVENVVELGAKLWFGAMNFTKLFEDQIDVSFELVTPEESEYIEFDEEGQIVFYAKEAATIKAIVTYDDDENGEQTMANVIPSTITPADLPEYKVMAVEDWAVYKSGDFNWNKKNIPAGDEGYQLVLKLSDSYGEYYVTHAKADPNKDNDLIAGTIDEGRFDEFGYSLRYYSTNTDDFLIDEFTGEIETYKKTNAVIYVALHQDTDEEDDVFVKNIYALQLKVDEARKADDLILSKDKLTMVADAAEANLVTNSEIKVKMEDQYGNAWTGATNYEITCSNEDASEGTAFSISGDTVTINSAYLWQQAGKTSYTFTVKDTISGLKDTFSVSLKKPDWLKDEEVNEDTVDGQFGKEIVVDQYKNTDKLTLDAKDVNLAWAKGESTDSFAKKAVISFYKTSNGYNIGYHTVDDLQVVTTTNWNESTYAVGTRLIAVTGPDGKLVKDGITAGAAGTWEVALTKNTNDVITYSKTGKYTVRIYTVTSNDEDGANYSTQSTTFSVSDSRVKVAFGERVAITSTESTSALAEVIKDAFTFTLGGRAWDYDTSVIGDVVATTQGDYVIIRDVTFKIPVDGSKELGAGEDYYTQTVKGINMSVKCNVAE